MCCCCWRLHRHQIHLISYGCVSFGLITTGLVFTVFAIFQKDSQIGKVWLAGPTTMVVGLVLCGKVLIDWGPAMLHAREGSFDTRLMEHQNAQIARMVDSMNRESFSNHQTPSHHEPNCNGATAGYSTPHASSAASSSMTQGHSDSPCLIISQYDSPLNNANGYQGTRTRSESSTRPSSSNHHRPTCNFNTAPISPKRSNGDICKCSQYGSIRRGPSPFQGEYEYDLNQRNYFV